MHKLINLLKQPHPAHDDPAGYLRTVTVIGGSVFLILYVFRPFGFSGMSSNEVLAAAVLFSGTAYLTMLACLVWIVLFPRLFAQQHWTLLKEMLLVVYQFTTIALAVWLLQRYRNEGASAPQTYLYTWLIVFLAGILPYLLATALKHVYYLRKNLRDATLINQSVAKATPLDRLSHMLVGLDGLPVPLRIGELLYIEADGNYLNVKARKNKVLQEYTVRGTLKQVADRNVQHPQLFRCHRAFIVNLSAMINVNGNAAGYQLLVDPELPTVPVSRSYIPCFKERMPAFHGSNGTGNPMATG